MFNIHRKLFVALKKVWIVKIIPPQLPFTPWKNYPPVKLPIPPTGGREFNHPPPPPTPYRYLENPGMGYL